MEEDKEIETPIDLAINLLIAVGFELNQAIDYVNEINKEGNKKGLIEEELEEVIIQKSMSAAQIKILLDNNLDIPI